MNPKPALDAVGADRDIVDDGVGLGVDAAVSVADIDEVLVPELPLSAHENRQHSLGLAIRQVVSELHAVLVEELIGDVRPVDLEFRSILHGGHTAGHSDVGYPYREEIVPKDGEAVLHA